MSASVMLFGVRRRLSTEDDFFTEGYMERNNDFKTVVLPSPSEQTVCGTSTSNFPCSVYLCNQSFSSITKLENHIYYCHRYQCSQCHKSFPSDHLLSIHLSERHDNYFRIMAKKLPSFVCYVEDCKSVFKNLNDRKVHMINVHQFPESFEFDSKERHKRNCKGEDANKMSLDGDPDINSIENAMSAVTLNVPNTISFGGRGRGRGRTRGR